MRYSKDFFIKVNRVLGKPVEFENRQHLFPTPYIVQTPGRHLIYDVHNEAILPDDVRFKIRTFQKLAQSEETKRYVPEVQEQIMTYFKE